MNSEVPSNSANELPEEDHGSSSTSSTSSEGLPALHGSAGSIDATSDSQTSPPEQSVVKPIQGWHRPLLLLILIGLASYSVILPFAIHALEDTQSDLRRRLEGMSLEQLIEVHSMKAFAVLWVFSLGATVGSFLNVVAYRMPRGKSVVFNASRCPQCNSAIRPTDNIPIFGWLRLEGRCRTCRMPISSRYPIVEALTATIFLILFSVELVTGGKNLPIRLPNLHAGIVWILFELRWDLISYFLYHCLLFSVILSWILIDLDRQKVTRLAIFVATILLVGPLALGPYLLPVPAIVGLDRYPLDQSQALLSSFAGGLGGLILGAVWAWLYHAITPNVSPTCDPAAEVERVELGGQPIPEEPSPRPMMDYGCVPSARNLISAMWLIGLGLGWQAAVTIVLITLAFRSACLWPMQWCRYRLPLSLFLSVGLLVHHVSWRQMFQLFEACWPGARFQPLALVILIAVVALLLVLNRTGAKPLRDRVAIN